MPKTAAPMAATGVPDLSLALVQEHIARHVPIYRIYAPTYHTTLLRSFLGMWDKTHVRLLDVGGGTGIIAQAMKDLFAIPQVTSVDIEDRFLDTLDIDVKIYDGARLPFADSSFDCVVFSNVLHHVPTELRSDLMRECARVAGSGPIYIKDHLVASRLDRVRLFALDAMGNLPFGGMVKASYLQVSDWQRLADDAGYRIDWQIGGQYRKGAFERLFPNRLEVTLKWIRKS